MKKTFLLLPLVGLAAYFTLSSNSTGYPTNRTGSDGVASTTGCGGAGCHGSAASTSLQFLPGGAILLDSAGLGTYVTSYTPGKTYVVHIGAANTSLTANLPKFGFQLSTVSGTGSTSVQAGTFGTAPAGTGFIVDGAGRKVFEQTTPRACTGGTGGPGSIDSISIVWTAPAAGTGTVTMFCAINGVNFDGGATAADNWNTANTAFPERADHTAVGNVANNITINTYPNPVTSALTLQLGNAANGVYGVTVFDMGGKLMASQNITMNGNSTATINMNSYAAGMYQVVVEKDGVRSVASIVKR